MNVRQKTTWIMLLVILAPSLVCITHAQSNQTNLEGNTESTTNPDLVENVGAAQINKTNLEGNAESTASSNLVEDTGTVQLVSATIIGVAGFGTVLGIDIVKERRVVMKIISWHIGIWISLLVVLVLNVIVIVAAASGVLYVAFYAVAMGITAASMAAIFYFRTMMMTYEIDEIERVARYRRMCRDAMGSYKSK